VTLDLEHAPMKERFEHLLKLMSGKRFLNREGLGNEVPFFICPFDPTETQEMIQLVKTLKSRLASTGIQVLEINLYDLVVELLQETGDWDALLEVEADTPKDAIKEQLQSLLEPQSHLIPAIARKMAVQEFQILFLTGVGEVFPYIRSHTVLNNLQSTAKDHPTVLFFPGTYTFSPERGSSLDLFGRLHDDRYYRAFNIYHCQI
jgi:hypothetical protein